MKLVCRQVRIIDGLGHVEENATLIIEQGHITAVGQGVPIPKRGTVELDVHGLTVLPGLMDCHVHLCLGGEADCVGALAQESAAFNVLKAAVSAQKTLAAGFTTVRDVGCRDHTIIALRNAISQGLHRGPRILAAGQVICMTGGHARFIGREADGPVDVTAAVRVQLAAGADVIKFIASGGILTEGTAPDHAQMTPEELSAGVSEARRAGRRVAAHAHGSTGIRNAVLAGVQSIEHATLMDEDAASLMRTHGVYMVPTLSALATTAACPMGCGIPHSALSKAKTLRARHERSFKQALHGEIPIALGTDAGTPFNFHGENAQELERMVALGMSPMQAIQSATSAAAALLGIDDRVGTIRTGQVADLLFVNGNPLTRIGMLRDPTRIMGVMQAGEFVTGPLTHEPTRER